MPKKSSKGLLAELQGSALQDTATLTITAGKTKHVLSVPGRIRVAGNFVYLNFPGSEGLFVSQDGNLGRAGSANLNEAETAFFPERKADLEKARKEIELLKNLAKTHGFNLSPLEGKATRAPRGSKPKVEPLARPKEGESYTWEKDGQPWKVESDNGHDVTLAKGNERRTTNHMPSFHRWHKKAS